MVDESVIILRMNPDDDDVENSSGLSVPLLLLTASTAAVLAAILVALALTGLSSTRTEHVAVRQDAVLVAAHGDRPPLRGSTVVYVVDSSDDEAALAAILGGRNGTNGSETRLVVVQTAADAAAGRLFDFTFLDQSSAGARISLFDLRPRKQ